MFKNYFYFSKNFFIKIYIKYSYSLNIFIKNISLYNKLNKNFFKNYLNKFFKFKKIFNYFKFVLYQNFFLKKFYLKKSIKIKKDFFLLIKKIIKII